MFSRIPTTNPDFKLINPGTKSLEECDTYMKKYLKIKSLI